MKSSRAKLLLLAVFMARGTSFLFSKHLMLDLSAESILAIRFLLSFAVLAVVFSGKLFACTRDSLAGGVILGVLYTVCMLFEMHGLKHIDTGVSSFIENMAIVLVPLYLAVLTRTLPKRRTILCALLAVTGVGCLSFSQVSQGTRGSAAGILLAILAALTYGVCILATTKVAVKGDPLTIGIVQLGVMGAASLVIALASGTFGLPETGTQWTMILLLALLCSCFGFAFQPVGQKYLPTETAAVFTVVNPLTTSILGILAAGEDAGMVKLAGYLLILIALVWYNLGEKGEPDAQAEA